MQIFIIILIALSIAQPFIMASEESLVGHTIIILDASASMQAGDRFQEAKAFALSQLGAVNTIIIAEDVPEVALRDGSQTDARLILNNLQPSDTVTNLYDAIKTVESLVKDKTKVVIASDFIDTASPSSYETAIRALRSQDHVVILKNVYKSARNVGITDMEVKTPQSSITIKNYDSVDKQVRLVVEDFSKDFSIEAGGVKTLDFDTPLGLNEVKIETDDDFEADNKVYIATPKEEKSSVLLIANKPNPYLQAALEENTEIDLSFAEPPTIASFDFDVIILGDVDADKILPGTIKSFKENAENKRAGIILAHDDIASIDYQSLLVLGTKQKGELIGTHPITSEIDFGSNEFLSSTSGQTLVQFNSSVAISFQDTKDGKIMYYGILDENSGFKFRLKYPIFWKESINFLLNRKKINEINQKTGKIITFEIPTKVKTPSGELITDNIVLDKAGFYDFGNFKTAANLLNFEESNINKEVFVEETLGEVIGSRGQVPLLLTFYLLLALVILIFLEVLYVKYRGDV